MSSTAELQTLARMQLVHLRLQALTLSMLVQRGVIAPRWASDVVQNAAAVLPSEMNDPATEKMLMEAMEEIASEMRDTPVRAQPQY